VGLELGLQHLARNALVAPAFGEEDGQLGRRCSLDDFTRRRISSTVFGNWPMISSEKRSFPVSSLSRQILASDSRPSSMRRFLQASADH
jgi:hypothetical protein